MQDINEARHRFRVILTILLAICLGATGVLLSPIGTSSKSLRQEIQQLRADLRAKELETSPLRGIDRKVVAARDEVTVFYRDRLSESYANISEELGAVASKSGVNLTTGHYTSEVSDVPGLERLFIEASISGDYLHTVKFINAAEREKMFFIIDGVSLTQQKGGIVQLKIKIEALLKEA